LALERLAAARMLFQTGPIVHQAKPRTRRKCSNLEHPFVAQRLQKASAIPLAFNPTGDLDMTPTAHPLATRTPNWRPLRRIRNVLGSTVCALAVAAAAGTAWAHGDVTPQAVDTSTLPTLGAEWRAENPFRQNEAAVKVGSSAYNQNCARCHGLEAISGGIAPDLRKLDNECASTKDAARQAVCLKENDAYFLTTVRRGRTRNGAVYMPPFEGMFNQEAMWAVKAYLESRRDKPL
jgi:cytochrome c-550 PedF